MIEHRDHDYTEAVSLIEPSKLLLEESREKCIDLSQELETVADLVKQTTVDLNTDTNDCALQIEKTFSGFRKALALREKALLSRLKDISDRKKQALNDQMAKLRELSTSCSELIDSVNSVLEVGSRTEDKHGGMHMVNTAHVVKKRASRLEKEINNTPKEPVVDPDIKCRINSDSKDYIENVLQQFGWLGTTDYPPTENKSRRHTSCIDINKGDGRDDAKGFGEVGGDIADAKCEPFSKGGNLSTIPLSVSLSLKSR